MSEHHVIFHGDTATLICQDPQGNLQHVKFSIVDLPIILSAPNPWSVYEYGKGRTKQKYCASTFKHKTTLLHRLIMGEPARKQGVVDHLDGDSLNCTRKNLQVISHGANIRKGRLSDEMQTGRKNPGERNVYKHGRGYQVNIMQRYLGTFKSEEDAIRVARAERARINFENFEQYREVA